MQADERAGPGVEARSPPLPDPVLKEHSRDGAMPRRPRFFRRRAWYRRRLESLEQEAVIDELTGLRNQRTLWRELSRRAPLCSTPSPLTLVMVDVDLFAQVNELHGHAVGDAILARAAAIVRAAAASARLAFRYGGDQVVVVVPGDAHKGSELAESLRSEISRQEHGGLPSVTISCGVAEFDSPVEPWVALDRVDAALREAKRGGRDRTVVAGETENTASAYLVEDREHETARRAALALAVATLEVRHRHTADHSDDVLTLCEAIGRQLRFDARALERLMAGAQLHDVGKVAIPSRILNKPAELNDDEWALIRKHTVLGERILRSVPEMADVASIVRHSHEHWDGGGYPDGLSGERIPLPSRIILCADAFHAIRCDRPYRAGRSAEEALKELRACAGTQFDPTVVDALGRVADDFRDSSGGGMALSRNKRLVILLTALAITGTAVAAVPGLRHAVRSVFAATSSDPGRDFSGEPGRGFSLGPLGDLLSIAPNANAVLTRDASAQLQDAGATPPSANHARGARDGPRGRPRDGARALRNSRVGRDERSPGQLLIPGAPTPNRDSSVGTQQGSPNPGKADNPAGPGEYCRAKSKHEGRGQPHSDFAECVRVRAKLGRGG